MNLFTVKNNQHQIVDTCRELEVMKYIAPKNAYYNIIQPQITKLLQGKEIFANGFYLKKD